MANAGGTTHQVPEKTGHQPVATTRACLKSQIMDAAMSRSCLSPIPFEAAGMPAGLQVERPAQPGGPGSYPGSVQTE
jgi:hypothetical protein